MCSHGLRRIYGVGKHETVRVLCELDADPENLQFHWRFNGSGRSIDLASFTVNGRESVATYVPHNDEEYGSLSCRATNEIGRQREPCYFTIVPAGIKRFSL